MTAEPARATLTQVPDGIQTTEAPHSIEAEQALLGAVLLNNQLYDELGGRLLPEHFYIPFHAAVFSTISKLVDRSYKADAVTVKENLVDKANFGDVDIAKQLLGLAENASMATDVSDLARIIQTRYLQRQLIELSHDLTYRANNATTDEDAAAIIANAEGELFKLAEGGPNGRDATTLTAPLKTVIDRAYEAKKNDAAFTGVSTGLKDVDELMGGLQPSDLIILAARPSMGKTALAVNIAYNAAYASMHERSGGAGVGIFSLEMSADQLAARILSAAAEVDSYKLDKGQLTDDEFRRLQATADGLCDMPLVIDDTPQLHVAALRARARRMVRQHNVGMIIVDYLQLMHSTSRQADGNRVQEISEISRGLKAIARELSIPVIALSQLSRAVEARDNKRPQLSDLRESGSIEQDADLVLFLYREEYYKEKQFGPPKMWNEQQKEVMNKIRGVAELLVSKNRKGPTGATTLTFVPQRTLFRTHADTSGYETMLRESESPAG